MNKISKRKFRKLKNTPGLFFKDFYTNRLLQLRNFIYLNSRKKKLNSKKFTIISAVYNVSEYLDDYLESLVNQRLDFETSIDVILVNDGSPDDSEIIIKKWIKKYPNNIHYIKKKNGGQSSARNLGLKFVKTEWVTFIDPDDFLDLNYFYLLNDTLEKYDHIGAFVTKFKLFKEKFGTYHDGFQTDFCFTKPIRVLKANDMEDCVQFSSSSSVYRTDVIHKNKILFDEKLTASFEDTKFFYDYLYNIKESNILYIKDAIYNYRLRSNESSSSNSQWTKKAKYQEFFQFGLLSVIKKYNENGTIPTFIQRLVLFSIIPYLQVAMINKKRIEDVLNESEINNLLQSIKECLSYVETNTLEKFYNSPGNYFWINAINNYFYNKLPIDKRVYINKVNLDENKVYFRFYGIKGKTKFSLKVNNKHLKTSSERVIEYKLFSDNLINEYNICYHIEPNKKIEFLLDGEKAKIYTDFKILSDKDTDFYKGYISKNNSLKNIALFIDSGYKADDNAEHLYEKLLKNKNLDNFIDDHYYLLDKESEHWNRLVLKGFNLVDIKSMKGVWLMKNAKYIFCSYLPGHLNEWATHHSFKFQKFIFLQHGIITSNLSKPFNASYSQIYKMVISSKFEKSEILDDKFNYIFHSNDLILSTIPRLDKLVNHKRNQSNKVKKILVCPTWRTSLGNINFNKKDAISSFKETSYIKNWLGLLYSDKLRNYLEEGKIEISFLPHQNFHQLLEENSLNEKLFFDINENIRILNPKKSSYQELFIDHDILITDFSSLHFDFATLQKDILYFQFDKDEFYGISHAYQKGLFNFEKDGFGQVTYTLEELLDQLVILINSQNEKVVNGYKKRISNVFLPSLGDSCNYILKNVFTNPKRNIN
ncbi:bifunctional glycosyltransferase/CDP-glycerol:glycerophosphate glycerophosphotransferase [Actinobacillus pleuropneumoniae]|uniref:bifunctional glycosyltransferase/CDP-glycerol:glycerophosphate glycerophosphotransferase n=1 Tax=Actinobacillus pleuropneumoniae TaxID=715 RepID=UPI003CFF8AB7